MIRNESDTAWKEILDVYLKDCIDYCLPELSKLIDWKKKWISLDKELNSITKDTATGKRLLDKLVKVYLINGQEQWILIHIEIVRRASRAFSQGRRERLKQKASWGFCPQFLRKGVTDSAYTHSKQ